ncbi:MAG: ABC transporter permease subunit [Chloroflexi bacterium]|nr:ABC transporter permease subunit [Chloroflexota bacterium]
MTVHNSKQQGIPFWRDERIIQFLSQGIALILVVAVVIILYNNMSNSLEELGVPLSLDFLKSTSSFDIGESLIEYSRSSTYLRAYLVGVINTIQVAILGITFATILGVIVGVARLSKNLLVSMIAAVYIEILRNIPLLVLLIIWYTGLFLKFPGVKEALTYGPIVFSNRGISLPWGIPTSTFTTFKWILISGLIVAGVVAYVLIQHGKRTGRMPLVSFWSLITFLGVLLIGWFLLPEAPLMFDFPSLPETGFNIVGGRTFSSEFMALLSGLVIYTSAFIGEVVRSGIQSVSKGQIEAARALGLKGFQTLQFIVFPQAMRVIVPPITSQYLSLTKNSSLAIAIGYPDMVHVYGTIINQSGRAVEMTAIMMATYMTFSLLISAFMNWYNKRIKFVER